MNSKPITPPITHLGLQVVVPDIEISKVSIAGDKITIKVGQKRGHKVSTQTAAAIDKTLDSNPDLAEELVDAYMSRWRPLPDSALDEFFHIGERPQDCAALVQKYGPMGEFEPGSDKLDHAAREISFAWSSVKLKSDRLRALLRLRDQLGSTESDDTAVDEAIGVANELGFNFTKDANRQLAIHLSQILRSRAKIGIAYENFRMVPRIYCSDVLTALHALLFKSLVENSPWSVCAGPKCGRCFRRTRGSKAHCSERCRQRSAQKRYRDKQS